MIDDLHKIPAPFTADAGWEQMQKMLDEHLPVKRHLLQREGLIACSVAATLLLIFLFCALQLDTHEFTGFTVDRSSKASEPLANRRPPLSQHNHFSAPEKSVILDARSSTLNFNTSPFSKKDSSTDANIATSYKTVKGISAENLKNEIHDTVKVETTLPVEKPATFLPADLSLSKRGGVTTKKWHLSGGVGVNMTLDRGRQNLQPYPVFEAKYNFSRRFYVSVGLSLYTPVATATKGINKSVYINDTLNNIRMFNETVTYNRLHYINLPLSLGVNISKNISFHAGMQMSVLVGRNNVKRLEQYDFQMNSITSPVTASLVSSNFSSQKKENITTQNIDYRFTTGMRYTSNKLTFELTHQLGLIPVLRGKNTDLKKNNILAFSVLYKLN